ncbi:zinc finger MYND domain-containing protein 11-like isoform X2 [Octopus sinensis]|uniref:Zinc finger MYND domain-containing protein 11-like isoform X2 n=1 Tax=Octopus sinensis TaxID=2607531 RepID=A0A6P7STF8_9MOLL|nr:zinc finger MYND domain-containing protein 11-like isoform X2 [Octopus sinensis]
MVWRRQATVVQARQLLNAIAYIKQQKQIPNLERITRYMQREHKVPPSETHKQLQNAVKDNLIISYTAIGNKGSKTGMEQKGYKISDESELVDDGHDWYCFKCHGPGDVISCNKCWRVFHLSCFEEEEESYTNGHKHICYICKDIQAGHNRIRGNMLNTLLGYTVQRLKEKTRELHRIGHRDEELNFKRFVYKPMDLNTMEQIVQTQKYRCVEELVADAHNIVHNVYLVYGEEHGMTELARIMIRDCKYDIDEICQCWNCYYMSNSKPANWFCKPCKPPHELVYAKLKGFSYWPAKVIRVTEDSKHDVRFFGGYHQRALIPQEYIKPISVNIKTVTSKRTQGFIKACEELKLHRQLLEEQVDESSNNGDSEMENNMEEDDEEEEDEEEDDDDDDDDEDEEADDDTETREVTSTSVAPPKNTSKLKTKILTPENVNVVSSSVDKISTSPAPRSSKVAYKHTASQATPSTVNKFVQSDTSKKSCNCQDELSNLLDDFKRKTETEHKKEIEQAEKRVSDRLQKEFEIDKQQAVARAVTNMQREIDRVRRQTTEKIKEQYMEEMKKLSKKHKEYISYVKKKQWCFFCGEEAMYHCCWNTAYCSKTCQKDHWQKEHKNDCRRPRPKPNTTQQQEQQQMDSDSDSSDGNNGNRTHGHGSSNFSLSGSSGSRDGSCKSVLYY